MTTCVISNPALAGACTVCGEKSLSLFLLKNVFIKQLSLVPEGLPRMRGEISFVENLKDFSVDDLSRMRDSYEMTSGSCATDSVGKLFISSLSAGAGYFL